jgi:hypothetical protein
LRSKPCISLNREKYWYLLKSNPLSHQTLRNIGFIEVKPLNLPKQCETLVYNEVRLLLSPILPASLDCNWPCTSTGGYMMRI